jgi:hypothetical protein
MHGHGERSILCTVSDCERGRPGNGFPHGWNLRDHIDQVHIAESVDEISLEQKNEASEAYINTATSASPQSGMTLERQAIETELPPLARMSLEKQLKFQGSQTKERLSGLASNSTANGVLKRVTNTNDKLMEMECTTESGQTHRPTPSAVDQEDVSEEGSSDLANDTPNSDSVTSACYLLSGPDSGLGSQDKAIRRLISQTATSKQVMVDRIMGECSELFNHDWTAIFRVCGQDGSYNSSTPPSQTVLSSENSSARGTERKYCRRPSDEGDSNGNKTKRSKLTKTVDIEKDQFACHFRKHNPTKYNFISLQYRSCAMSHWNTIARVKLGPLSSFFGVSLILS